MNFSKRKIRINEAVENYIHPGLEAFGTEYEPTVHYLKCSKCSEQKTNESHQATHVCVVITDERSYDAWEFKRSHGLSNYEVVAEFSPDPGEDLIEKSLTRYKRRNRFMSKGYHHK